jgi:PAS domain S-box-containing protein
MKPDVGGLSTSQRSRSTSKAFDQEVSRAGNSSSFFPFFEWLTENIDIPFAIYCIIPPWFTLQTIFCVFWLPGSSLLGRFTPLTDLANLFSWVSVFASSENSDSGLLISMIVTAVIFLLMVIIEGIVLFSFSRLHVYVRVFLLPGRILTEIIPIVMIYPSAHVAGRALALTLESPEIKNLLIFIAGMLFFILFAVIFRIAFGVLGYSPYIAKSPLSHFESGPFILHVIGSSFFLFLSELSDVFTDWFWYVMVGCHAIVHIYFAYQYGTFPFMTPWMNILCLSICFYSVLMDLIAILERLVFDSPVVLFILIFVIAVISTSFAILYNWFSHRSAKRTLKNLPTDSRQSEEEAYRLFDDMRLNSSARKTLFFLDYAIQTQRMKLYDFTYMTYTLTNFQQTNVLSHCARVVSWLPHMARPLNWMCRKLSKRRDLSLRERFLLFQLDHIRLTRESSSSHAAQNKLIELKTLTAETSQTARTFWERSDCNIAMLRTMSTQLAQADMTWIEAIGDFPNNPHMRDLYITYCIESTMRFGEAVFQKYRSELLESGANFLKDGCFRRFVRRWPRYLKQRIVDTKGRLHQGERHKSESSSLSSSSSSNMSLGGTLDQAIEESVGRNVLLQSRVRLTVERTFQGHRPFNFMKVVIAAIVMFIGCLGTFMVIAVYFQTFFDGLNDVANRLMYINRVRMYFVASALCWMYFWGTQIDAIHYDEMIEPIFAKEPKPADSFIPSNMTDWSDAATHFNVLSRNEYESLMNEIVTMGKNGMNLDVYARNFFDSQAMPLQFCSADGDPNIIFRTNVRTAMTYLFMMESIFMTEKNISRWFTFGESQCVIFRTLPNLTEPFAAIRPTLTLVSDELLEQGKNLFEMMRIWLPLAVLGFCLITWLPVSFLYIREVNKFTALLLNLPKPVKRESAHSLRRDSSDDEQVHGNSRTNRLSIPILFNSAILILIIGSCILLCLQAEDLKSTNDTFSYLSAWIIDSRTRKAYVLEGAFGAIMAVLGHNQGTQNPTGENYLTLDAAQRLVTNCNNELTASNTNLLDSVDSPSSIGWNPNIDELTITPQCEENSESTYHEMYRCASAMQLINFVKNTIILVMINTSVYEGEVGHGSLGELIHLLDVHLLPLLILIDEQYQELVVQQRASFVEEHMLYFAGEVILFVILFGVIAWYCETINGCYDILLSLMRRVPPGAILACPPLEEYLLGRASLKRRVGMSADERIIDASLDSVICTNANGTIDLINPAVTKGFGFSPEQLLGQTLSSLMPGEHGEKIEQQLKLMSERQTGLVFEGHTVCLADDETEIPCWISIFALLNGDDVSSFVAIIRDETDLLAQQEAAEAAKQQSEKLLFQILPRDIVTRLNSGEKDISFSIASATVMFIDIVKFSEYAANLTPQEIMGNLSEIFAGFDEACSHYPLLIKIKLIGDVYMCAGGLFSPDISPSLHAEQMIRFALECLQVIDCVNEKLGALLSVRIGINSGGPILAGVLGIDRPTFDIIGDPINVASRLQSTDLPGRIQISESTQELVSGMDFPIEFRGEIELKGKGKQKTYLIDPQLQANTIGGLLQSTLDEIVRLVPSHPH